MDVVSSYNPFHVTQTLASPMRTSLSLLRALSLRRHVTALLPHSLTTVPVGNATKPRQHPLSPTFASVSAASQSTFLEQVKNSNDSTSEEDKFEEFDFEKNIITEGNSLEYDIEVAGSEMKRLDKPVLEVKELEELPELWRRSKLAWLCKEVPVQKARTFDRLLNAQKKWLKQEDATYLAVHCMRIRENDAAFRVYKWMMQQHWYRFDFALATKLADYMGRERKFSKCRETFDDIINQGRVPSESTFHILIVAYLSAPVQGCLDEACSIYNRMIQLGGYQPSLSLHNSLFKALVSKPGGSSKHYLKQAEFIFHNLVTTGLKIQKDIYSGLIWLHSYQDTVDKERITKLREEMRKAGIEEGKEVLLSLLRVCAKEGDVEEAERIWPELQNCENVIPTQAFVYKMEAYAENRKFMKSLDIFREMQNVLGFATVPAYHKIIEVLCDAQETEFTESLMKEFVGSGMKPLMPSYINLTSMYLNLGLHDRLRMAFFECLGNCRPNRTIYNIYMESLIKVGDLEKAEDAFNKMQADQTVGINTRSCNTILSGYLSSGDYVKAEKIYDLMCQKKYDIEPPLMEKLDYVLSLTRKEVKKPMSLKLKKEQREILVGLLLGGLRIESDEQRKKHMLRFEFNKNSSMHSVLRGHLYDEYHEWLHPSSKPMESNEDVPFRFATISHSYFGFYADQFWPKGTLVIPKLIHRWLSPRVLAYWFMFSGHRTSVGDILLKVKGNHDGVEKVVKAFNAKSLECRVKRKGKVFWIGFLGSNSTWFWKLIEPYVLEDIKEDLKTKNGGGGGVGDNDDTVYRSKDTQDINFDSGSDSEGKDYDNSDDENS